MAQLGSHRIERAHQDAKLVLRLFGNLIIKISRGYFARAFGKRLNRYGHLLGKKECQPHNGEEEQNSEERQNKQNLPFQREQILFLGVELTTFILVQAV